ncbi:MAG: aminotransferase class I/II-fold pyridoxal phosphate-dependent enzyme [Bacteroidota bacterium]
MNILTNDNISGLKASATLAINERSIALQQAGEKIIRLGFGQSPFPVPDIVVETLRKNAYQKDYLPVKGLFALRAAVADYHQRKFSINCTAEDVLIGPGSKELLFLTQLIYKGTLMLPQPSWVSYAPQAQLSRKQYVYLPTKKEDSYMLSPQILEEYCVQLDQGPKILLLNYPSNPTGATLPPTQLEALAQVARKYRILLLSDEIYGDTHFTGAHQSIASYYPEGTIVSSGLSKWCGAGGWRLGTFVFPEQLRWLLDKMAVVASETFTSTSAPIQYAAVAAYQAHPQIEEYLRKSRAVLKIIGEAVHTRLATQQIFCPSPRGGFYLMPDFSFHQNTLAKQGIRSSQQLCDFILEELKVALLPLSDFGMPDHFLGCRLSYVDFDGKKALDQLSNDSTPEDLAPKVFQGIDHILAWIAKISA